jgi:hypothetical protein
VCVFVCVCVTPGQLQQLENQKSVVRSQAEREIDNILNIDTLVTTVIII